MKAVNLAGACALVLTCLTIPTATAVPLEGAVYVCQTREGGLGSFKVTQAVGSGDFQYWVMEEQWSATTLISTSYSYDIRVGWIHGGTHAWKTEYVRLWSGFSGDPDGGHVYTDFADKKKSSPTGTGTANCGEVVVRGAPLNGNQRYHVDAVFSGFDWQVANGLVTEYSVTNSHTTGSSDTVGGSVSVSQSGVSGGGGYSHTWSRSDTSSKTHSLSNSRTAVTIPYFEKQSHGFNQHAAGGLL